MKNSDKSNDQKPVLEKVTLVVPPAPDYPNEELWKTIIKSDEKIVFINGGDFHKGDMLEGIQILDSQLSGSFGIYDAEEIKKRQNLCRFVMDNPNFGKWLEDHQIDSLLPTSQVEFMRAADPELPHNQYWENVRSFVDIVESSRSVPVPLQKIAAALKASYSLEAAEQQMNEIILDRLEKTSVVVGTAQFRIIDIFIVQGDRDRTKNLEVPMQLKPFEVLDLSAGGIKVYGHSMYSFDIDTAYQKPYPEWVSQRWNPLAWIAGSFIKRRVDKENQQARAKAFESMVITEPSIGLIEDLKAACIRRLNEINWTNDLHMHADVSIRFRYSESGLQVGIYDFECQDNDYYPLRDFDFKEFMGYSQERLTEISRIEDEYREYAIDRKRRNNSSKFLMEIEKQDQQFFSKTTIEPSRGADIKYQWFAIPTMYEHPAIKPVADECKKHRRFFSNHLWTLKNIVWLVNRLQEKADSLGAPLSIPEILKQDQHLVTFDVIYPLHLLNAEDIKPVPIAKMVPINGAVIGLTGCHGGGKTVTALSLVDNIFLAQSGLPIFGRGFQLNPKRCIALVFLERKNGGSTCEILIDKIISVFKGIKDHHGSQVVVILDELGTGTQEGDGDQLGRDVLKKLTKLGVSVIFTTQIQSLALWAHGSLKAQCYKFDDKHKMTPGIGDGGMSDLRKRKGLDRLLSV
ncbi:MAG: hypothetical protein M1338_01810 [Patescibacteria group bacterium]|nr:hypothetical protein [Patescibacteria group bacterium]